MTKSDSSNAAPILLLLLPYDANNIGAIYTSLEIQRTIDLASRYDGDSIMAVMRIFMMDTFNV